jgi:hypothetical protein
VLSQSAGLALQDLGYHAAVYILVMVYVRAALDK